MKIKTSKPWWWVRFGLLGIFLSLIAFLVTLYITPGMIEDLALVSAGYLGAGK
jgi:hypothetical protein